MPKPYQKPRPPICVAAASPGSQTVRLAGKRGWGLISAYFLTDTGLATHWDMLRKGAPKPANGRAARIGASCAASCRADRRRSARAGDEPRPSYRYSIRLYARDPARPRPADRAEAAPDMPDDEVTVEKITDSRVIFGSPGTVLDKLAPFATAPARSAALDDRRRLERPERGLGAPFDAASGARGDAEIPPAHIDQRSGVIGTQAAQLAVLSMIVSENRFPRFEIML